MSREKTVRQEVRELQEEVALLRQEVKQVFDELLRLRQQLDNKEGEHEEQEG